MNEEQTKIIREAGRRLLDPKTHHVGSFASSERGYAYLGDTRACRFCVLGMVSTVSNMPPFSKELHTIRETLDKIVGGLENNAVDHWDTTDNTGRLQIAKIMSEYTP